MKDEREESEFGVVDKSCPATDVISVAVKSNGAVRDGSDDKSTVKLLVPENAESWT